jgi:hypothetical protein
VQVQVEVLHRRLLRSRRGAAVLISLLPPVVQELAAVQQY